MIKSGILNKEQFEFLEMSINAYFDMVNRQYSLYQSVEVGKSATFIYLEIENDTIYDIIPYDVDLVIDEKYLNDLAYSLFITYCGKYPEYAQTTS